MKQNRFLLRQFLYVTVFSSLMLSCASVKNTPAVSPSAGVDEVDAATGAIPGTGEGPAQKKLRELEFEKKSEQTSREWEMKQQEEREQQIRRNIREDASPSS